MKSCKTVRKKCPFILPLSSHPYLALIQHSLERCNYFLLHHYMKKKRLKVLNMTFPFQQWQHILKIDHASIPWQHNSSLIKTFKAKENTKGDSKLKILLISSCHSWPLLSVSLLFARMAVHHTCFTACFLPRVIESNQACNWLVWKLEQKEKKNCNQAHKWWKHLTFHKDTSLFMIKADTDPFET